MRLRAEHNKHIALACMAGARQWGGVVHTRKGGHCEELMWCVEKCCGRVVDVFG